MANSTENYVRALSRLETRISNIERNNQSQAFTSIENTRLEFRDEDGNVTGTLGIQDDGSTGFVPVLPPEEVKEPRVLAVPTAPLLDESVSAVSVTWDGQTRLSEELPMDFYCLEIHASETEDFEASDLTLVSALYEEQGSSAVVGPIISGTWYFRLRLKARNGEVSEASEASSIEVTLDLPELNDVLENAQGGKNIYSPTPPVPGEGGFGPNDIWFDSSIDPDTGLVSWMPHRWDETAGEWVSIADERIAAIKEAQDLLRDELDTIVETAGSNNFYKPVAPKPTDATPPKEGDLWFDTSADGNNTAHYWNGTEWISLEDARLGQLQQAQTDFTTELNEVQQTASSAQQSADSAQASAETAQQTADQAKADATSKAQAAEQAAKDYADAEAEAARLAAIATASGDATAKADAAKAQAKADAALDAKQKADAAQQAAEAKAAEAKSAADAAQATANDAKSKAEAAHTAAGSAQNAADAAMQAATHSSKNLFSTANPSGSAPWNTIWFKYDGTGRIIGQWQQTGGDAATEGSTWTKRDLDNSVIANLDAGKITSGFIDVARLKANSIGADKLLIGSDRNMIPNGDLSSKTIDGWPTRFVYQNTDTPPETSGAANITGITSSAWSSTIYPVTPGETVVFECWIKADKPNSKAIQEVRDQTGAHLGRSGNGWVSVEGSAANTSYPMTTVLTVPTTWTKIVSKIKVPTGVTGIRPAAFYPNHSSGTERTATVSLAGFKLYQQVGKTLIQDGAVTTQHIATGSITAASGIISEIDASVITVGKLLGSIIAAQTIIGSDAVLDGSLTAKSLAAGTITAESGVIGSLDLGKATVGELDGVRIKAGTINTDQLNSTAINGMEIVAAKIYTSKTGARIQLLTTGLSAYSSSNVRTFNIASNTGDVEMIGKLFTGTSGGYRTVLNQESWDDFSEFPIYGGGSVKSPMVGSGLRLGKDTSVTTSAEVFYAEETYYTGTVSKYLRLNGPTVSSRRSELAIGTSGLIGGYRNTSNALFLSSISLDSGGAALRHEAPASGVFSMVDAGEYSDKTPYASVWTSNSSKTGDNNSVTVSSKDVTITGNKATMTFTDTSNGPRVQSTTIWDVNSSSGDPVRVNGSGTLFKSSSSRRYKTDIQDAEDLYSILEVEPKTWLDNEDLATFEREQEFREEVPIGPAPQEYSAVATEPPRIYGAVAEEVDDLGLSQLVSYDAFNRPDGLHYDKFGVALIPVVRDLSNRIAELENLLAKS